MGFEKNIEDLFKSEDLNDKKESKSHDGAPSELPALDLPPNVEGDEAERRQFTRINVEDHRISVRFHNELHFAKHYVENISIGGLFIKTTEKYSMGELVPVAFEV